MATKLSSLDEIEVDPSEEMKLLASLEFGRDDIRDGAAQAEIKHERLPFRKGRKRQEPAQISGHRDNRRN